MFRVFNSEETSKQLQKYTRRLRLIKRQFFSSSISPPPLPFYQKNSIGESLNTMFALSTHKPFRFQWRIQTLSLGGGPVLFYLPSRLFFLHSFLLFSLKLRGSAPTPDPYPRSARRTKISIQNTGKKKENSTINSPKKDKQSDGGLI